MKPSPVNLKLDIIGMLQMDIYINIILAPDVLWCTVNTDKVLLSQKLCRQVGLIPEGFSHFNWKKFHSLTVEAATKMDAEGFDMLPDLSK